VHGHAVTHEGRNLMRTPILSLLLGPMLLLATACGDQLVTAPLEALFSTTDGDAVSLKIPGSAL